MPLTCSVFLRGFVHFCTFLCLVSPERAVIEAVSLPFCSFAQKSSYGWLLSGLAKQRGVVDATAKANLVREELSAWEEWIFRELPFCTMVSVCC